MAHKIKRKASLFGIVCLNTAPGEWTWQAEGTEWVYANCMLKKVEFRDATDKGYQLVGHCKTLDIAVAYSFGFGLGFKCGRRSVAPVQGEMFDAPPCEPAKVLDVQANGEGDRVE